MSIAIGRRSSTRTASSYRKAKVKLSAETDDEEEKAVEAIEAEAKMEESWKIKAMSKTMVGTLRLV